MPSNDFSRLAGGWHGPLLTLVVAVLVVLLGLVVAALVLTVRAERLHSADRS